MRFLRQLAAATLIVAVVVVIGLAWNHFAAGTLVGGLRNPAMHKVVPGQRIGGQPAGAGTPARRIVTPGPHPVSDSGSMSLGLGAMLDPVNLPCLQHTVVIEAGVLAAVVIIDAGRRRSRRRWRARRLAAAPSRTDGRAGQMMR